MTPKMSPAEYLKQHGDSGYAEYRVAKNEDRIAKDSGFAATRQGDALVRRYRDPLIEIIAADRKAHARRNKELWNKLRRIKNLPERLLHFGVTVAASATFGVNRYGVKHRRNVALWLGENLDQKDTGAMLEVGVWGINMLVGLPLFDLDENDVLCIRMTDEIEEFLDKVLRSAAANNPYFLPVIEPPLPWTDVRSGGVPADCSRKVTLVNDRTSEKEIRRVIKAGGMWLVLDAINALQNVQFVINEPVLNVALKMAPPIRPADNTLKKLDEKLWRKEKRRERREKQIALDYNLGMALAEQRVGKLFWIPLKIDFRGRIYGVPHFNFQRTDYIRGLFLFAEPEPIGEEGLLWLAAHVAGRADGNDFEFSDTDKPSRLNFERRLAWVEANMDRLRAIGEAVRRGDVPDLPTSMEEPIQFIAACHELVQAIEAGPGFLTRLPLTFDASCSGLQHLCAMTRSHDGRYANLTSCNEAADFYSDVARQAEELFTDRWFVKFNDVDKNLKTKIRLKTFPAKTKADDFAKTVDVIETGHIDVKIDRAIAKQPTLSYFYGATRPGMTKQVTKVLDDKELPTTGASRIASAIYDAVEHVAPLARAVRHFLERLAELYADRRKNMSWTTPAGMPVVNDYYKPDVVTFDKLFKGRRRQIELAVGYKDEIDKDGAKKSVTANFVHSMDAAHLHMVAYEAARQKIEMVAVHDSFGCLAPHAGQLYEIIRGCFVELYQRNYVLYNIWRSAKDKLPDADIPDPPWPSWAPHLWSWNNVDELDLNQILNSYHAFK
jgi:DNA-directed RNA polymerase